MLLQEEVCQLWRGTAECQARVERAPRRTGQQRRDRGWVAVQGGDAQVRRARADEPGHGAQLGRRREARLRDLPARRRPRLRGLRRARAALAATADARAIIRADLLQHQPAFCPAYQRHRHH